MHPGMTPILLALVLQSAPPPPPPPPPVYECYPACRAGFVCGASGQCVSACNPACGAGEQCDGQTGQCIGKTRPSVPLTSFPVVSEDGRHAPGGFHYEQRRSKGLIAGGAVMAGVAYGVSALAAVLAYDNSQFFTGGYNSPVVRQEGAYLLYALPFVGPIAGRAAMTARYGGSVSGAVDWMFAIIMSTAQMAGVTMAILGSRETEHLVSDEEYAYRRPASPPPMRLSLSPGAPGSAMGFTLTLTN